MIDRTFNLTLVLLVLIGSTLAIGSDLLWTRSSLPQASSAIAVLPRVVITGSVTPAATLVAQDQSQAESVVQ